MENLFIGDTVAFNSHPYSIIKGDNLVPIIIGEHLLTAPVMVVVEILHHTEGSYNPEDGSPINEEKSQSCKCTWYNGDTHQFEEAWFPQKQLKKIACNELVFPEIRENDETEKKKLKDRLVSLKTLKLELGKKKSFLSIRGDKESNNENHYLAFVSPVMQIVDIKKFDFKEPPFDQKTGKLKRGYPKFIAKCKWYNPNGQKFM